MSGHERLTVALGRSSYDILVGEGLIACAGRLVKPFLPQPRAMIVTDENVAPLHLAALERALAEAEIEAEAFVLPPGEETKCFAQLEQLSERLVSAGIERGTTLIALGGGVIGDLAGFAAAVLLRGLGYIQIPTTLLAQVDSSVGGKTGIDLKQGKNLIGAFHQPLMVLADSGVLATLPDRELKAGYAEIVKYGVLGDAAFFSWLEGHGHLVLEGDPAAQRQAVLTSCAHKAEIVASDERERGRRALLNLGHTFAHALEVECGFAGELLHGEAVAIGMVLAAELSVELGHCPPEEADRLRRHLASLDLPTGFERLGGRFWDAGRLLEHMRRDKKVSAGRPAFVLLKRIGEAFVARDVPLAEVERVLAETIAETATPLPGMALSQGTAL